jgi:predicted phosphodiesterase
MGQTKSSTTRIALLSDIHGNLVALEAILADIEVQGGVDEYWVLGDLVAIGPQPVQVLERLNELPNLRLTRGNTDRYVATGDRPPPTPEAAIADPSLLPILIEVANSFSWTQGSITAHGWLAYLDALPLEQRAVLPDGSRLLGVHASPGCDDGQGIHPQLSETELQASLAECQADIVCVGHTHWPININVGDIHLINLGSVGNPAIPGLYATYVMLEASQSGYNAQHRLVDYDREAVIRFMFEIRYPAADFIAKHMRGEKIRPWGKPEI